MRENKEIIEQLYHHFANKDNEAIRSLMAPDIVWTQMQGFPNGGIFTGADAIFANVFSGFREHWQAFKTVATQFLEAGSSIVVLGYYEGVYKQTGKYVKAAFAHHYQLQNGKIQQFDQYTDTFLIAEAMRLS
jgi:ketosteroid isomerase-like protein